MQMQVKDLLPGCFSVGQKKVEPFAQDTGSPERRCQPLGNLEDMSPRLTIHLGQAGGVDTGNDQQVARVDRLDIHEGHNKIIGIDDACRC
jgi:hypothetical protein